MPPVSREFFWNVGHGVLPYMYAFFVLTLVIFLHGFHRRLRVYRQGKPLRRLDHLPRRILRQWRSRKAAAAATRRSKSSASPT